MRFYLHSSIDKQGRINLRGIYEEGTKVIFSIDERSDDLVFVERVSEAKLTHIPNNIIYKVDSKGRVNMPKYFRKDAKAVFISLDDDKVCMKLV